MARKNSFFKLDMLLLCIIAKQDCYGYEITKQIKTYSHELIDIKEGTMYPILYKLLDENYISSYEKVIDRKVRVYYHIEEKGKDLNEYLDDHLQCSYDDIVQQFGEPKDIVVNYIQNSDENDLIKRMKLKSIIQKFLIFFSVTCTILAIWIGILWYDYIQDQKNSIIYEIETTITEH